MPQIVLDDETFARLQKHAVPLVDDANSVVARALDALDAASDNEKPEPLAFGMTNTPDLSFTTVKFASVDGKILPSSETFWNSILLAVVRVAAGNGLPQSQITQKLLANYVAGKKEEGGYKYLPEIDLSIQGLDANGAWKATALLAQSLGIQVKVQFAWQNHPKAAKPGAYAALAAGMGQSVFD